MHYTQMNDTAHRDDAPGATGKSGPRWVLVSACLLCMATTASSSALLLPYQSIWVDESTQMSGLEASPIAAVGWLAGGAKYNTWLQDDRMPPLSYWAGWVWSRTFGLAEVPMRWLSITSAVVATGLVVAASCRAWGLASGVCAGLLLGLSPNVLDHALEIRAYCLSHGVRRSSRLFGRALERLASPGFSLAPANDSMCGCGDLHSLLRPCSVRSMLSRALFLFPRRGGSTRHVLLAIAVTGITCTGVLPFVLLSLQRSANESGGTPKLLSVAQWMYRLYSHPTISLSLLQEGMAALGFVLSGRRRTVLSRPGPAGIRCIGPWVGALR